MKRKVFISIIAIICLLISSCVAFAEIDLSTMSDEELSSLISQAQQELNSRKSADGNDQIVLYDSNNIKWYITGYEVSSWSSYLTLNSIVENNSNADITINVETLTVDGWDVSAWFYAQATAGKKTKEDLSFNMEDANIERVDDISNIEASIRIFNSKTYNNIDQTSVSFNPVF